MTTSSFPIITLFFDPLLVPRSEHHRSQSS
jgi:hypothetical protein